MITFSSSAIGSIVEAYFQCGERGKRRGIHPGEGGADEVVRVAWRYREEHHPSETLFVGVRARRTSDGLICRFAVRIEPGKTTVSPAWQLTG